MRGETITANRVHADDVPPGGRREAAEWVEAHGFTEPHAYVLQAEIDLVDCPLARLWWLTKDDVDAVSEADYVAAGWSLLPFAHVTEVALTGPLPSWWQPEILRAIEREQR